jgi:hypothetical protein
MEDSSKSFCGFIFFIIAIAFMAFLIGLGIAYSQSQNNICNSISNVYNVKSNIINHECFLQLSDGTNYNVEDFLKNYTSLK